MKAFTIFKISKQSPMIVQWFSYRDNLMEGFGIEPNGDWLEELYNDRIPFEDQQSLSETERYNLLIQDLERHDYFVSQQLPPHLILKPKG